ncbi:MAG: hypothetical protein ABIJ86_03310, partial [Spirochaetota bacterium]
FYHVTARVNHKEMLLRSPVAKELFLEQLIRLRIYGTWGRFWGARYFSRPISGLGDLAATLAYVDNNPVRAGLVDRAEDWPWSGLATHRNGHRWVIGPPPSWLKLVMPNHVQLALQGQSLELSG